RSSRRRAFIDNEVENRFQLVESRGMHRLALASLAAAAAGVAGCDGDPPRADAAPDGFDRPAMLAHLGQQVLLPIQEAFAERAAAVAPAIEAYCAALDAGPPGPTLDAARAAWRGAVDAWPAAEALLVGPAVADMRTLRERIYAW